MSADLGKDLLLWQLRAELAQRDATIAQRDATIALLQSQLEHSEAQLTVAHQRIAELQAQLARHFKARAEPPAGGAAAAPPKALPRPKRGAQPVHTGSYNCYSYCPRIA